MSTLDAPAGPACVTCQVADAPPSGEGERPCEQCAEESLAPCLFIIFGASGDLTQRKLIPALYALYRKGKLPDGFEVLGAARSPLTDEAFRERLRPALGGAAPAGTRTPEAFLERLHYQPLGYSDSEGYRALGERIAALESGGQTGRNRLFYLAVPPGQYEPIVSGLGASGLVEQRPEEAGFARVVIEKPFGRDLDSALALDATLHRWLSEEQIYRIDHYLGKETVQNILMLRFANALFEPIWNQRYVDHVQIIAAERLGVGHRAGYYESAGLVRDMLQNHLLQLMALVAMEPPASFDAERVRDERVKLLRAIKPFPTGDLHRSVVLGQYGEGQGSSGPLLGYRQEPGVAPDSRTETYLAVGLGIDNWRWRGVPFYLRAGKRLGRKRTQVAIVFKEVPHSIFGRHLPCGLPQNVLLLDVQPDEGIRLSIQAKRPGAKVCMSTLEMRFDYGAVFGGEPPEAYERLLLDAILGDPTLFVRSDGMEVSWGLITPLLQQAEAGKLDLHSYPAGSWGPAAADQLLRADGRSWLRP